MKRKITLLILSVVMGSLTIIAQNVLDLSGKNPSLKIKDTIDIKKEHKNIFIIDAKDSITISKIVFVKNGNEAKRVEIKEGGNLLIKMDSVKNDISKTIKISPKSILTVTWGKNTWTFKMKDNNMNLSRNKTGENTKTKEVQDKPNSILYIIIVIIIGVVISVFGFCWFKRNKRTSSKSKGGAPKATAEAKTSTIEIKDDANITQSEKPSDIQVKVEDENDKEDSNNETIATDDINETENELDKQIATVIKGFEEEFFNDCNDRNSKIEKLQEILSIHFNLLNDKKHISKELCGNDNSDTQQILIEIKELKVAKTSSESKNNNIIAVSKIEHLIKANEISKSIYNDETNGDFEVRFKQLLEKLCKKVQDSIDTKSADGRYEAQKYVIEQLKINGFDRYFASNTTLKSGLEKIKVDIDKGKSSRTTSNPDNTDDATTNHPLDFERFAKKLHSQLPEISDNINSLDDLVEFIKDLIKNHQNAERDITNSSENTEETAISNFLKEVGMHPTASQEDAIKQIKEAIAKVTKLDNICKQYGIDNAEGLLDAIKKHIYKSIKGQLESKNETKEIIASCHTTEGIVKELSDAYIEVGIEKKKLEEERKEMTTNLKEAYTNVGNSESTEDSNMNEMFKAYQDAVCQKIATEKANVEILQQEVSAKQEIIKSNHKTFSNMLSGMNEVMKKDIDDIQASIAGPFIRPCDMTLKPQCDENQSLLREAFKKFSMKLQATEAIGNYAELYHKVQDIIEEDITNEYGLTNVLSRYYSYSCLPFMTDQAREYGMRIDHESMMCAYNALSHLANRFGLQLIVPNLFADRISDGEYKDCTGENYGDLENLCPGVANYVLEISNSDKQNYITDLVRVGYKKDYNVKQKAMVIVAQ
nr:hypothetical protein [uncultured Prevotella sp.]